MCQPMIDRFGHSLMLQMPPEPVFLDADPARLSQVLGNLVNNACKFTPSGGKIEILAERENGNVVIKVRDNGIGIPPGQESSIFDMFAQVDRPVDESQGGLGIGLTLTKQLIEMHSGSIEAHSDGYGTGTEFHVRLPVLHSIESRQTAEAAPEKPPTAARRILIVDDNFDSAESMSILLGMIGNECEMAHTGPQAIELAETFRPNVILLDIGLPVMDGYEVCRIVRSQTAGKDISIIAMTGWGQEDDRRRSIEAGFDAHIVKPVDMAQLLKLIDRTPE
jgi:CheY-like chemotaxis protein